MSAPGSPFDDRGERADLLRRIGALWRGDWSGHVFDGHDGQRWIETALSGHLGELAQLRDELDRIEAEYE